MLGIIAIIIMWASMHLGFSSQGCCEVKMRHTHSTIVVLLVCFLFLAIMNDVSVNILAHVFW